MIDESQMTLAVDMVGDGKIDGWLASEKLNGCRAYWDGKQFWTRAGNIIDAPQWFTRGLPAVALDGEIHAGRGTGIGNANTGFQRARVAVQNGGHWFDDSALTFSVFDCPHADGNWLRRMTDARKAIKGCAHAAVVRIIRMTDIHHFVRYLTGLKKLGAEGAMFRNPNTIGYEIGRSKNLLRFKYAK